MTWNTTKMPSLAQRSSEASMFQSWSLLKSRFGPRQELQRPRNRTAATRVFFTSASGFGGWDIREPDRTRTVVDRSGVDGTTRGGSTVDSSSPLLKPRASDRDEAPDDCPGPGRPGRGGPGTLEASHEEAGGRKTSPRGAPERPPREHRRA